MTKYIFLLFILLHIPPACAQAAADPSPSLQVLADRLDEDERRLADWPQLSRYRDDNAKLGPPAAGEARVVFFGDSITDNWGRGAGEFFPRKPYVNRGISGQTTPQMLVRFSQDVVALKPRAVVVLAGTNDIAGNTGPATPQMIEDNFSAMAAIARQNGIKVVFASILPAAAYPWRPNVRPVGAIRDLNAWLKAYCARERLVYLDYYSAMVGSDGGMQADLSSGRTDRFFYYVFEH